MAESGLLSLAVEKDGSPAMPNTQIADIAVIGLPDTVTGERACAVVSIVEGQDPITLTELHAYLENAGLRKTAIPEQLATVESIPRNPSGKITKNVLQEQFTNVPFER